MCNIGRFYHETFHDDDSRFCVRRNDGGCPGDPSMLPDHPGYPSGGDFANDTGQRNLTYSQSLMEAAKSGDTTMTATLNDQKDADTLSVDQEPNVKTGPSTKEGERMKK